MLGASNIPLWGRGGVEVVVVVLGEGAVCFDSDSFTRHEGVLPADTLRYAIPVVRGVIFGACG